MREFEFSSVLATFLSQPAFDELNDPLEIRFIFLPVGEATSRTRSDNFQCVGFALLHQPYKFNQFPIHLVQP